jgi:hypothetical protein
MMVMTILNFQNDVKGYNSYAPEFSSDKYSASLAAAGSDDITVPSGNFTHWVASFAYEAGAAIWVSVNGTAAAPAGGTFATTASQLLPGALAVKAGDVIDFYNNSAGTADVGVIFYAIS